jgi:hypothetical protein
VSLRMSRTRAHALVDVENGLIDAGAGGRNGWVTKRRARSHLGRVTTRACNELYDADLIDIDAATGRAVLTDAGRTALRLAYAWK